MEFLAKILEPEDNTLTRDDQRYDKNVLVDSEKGVSFIVFDDKVEESAKAIKLGEILKFESKELKGLKKEALNDELVDERRTIDLEKGMRGEKIYNEGVRYGAQAGLKSTLETFKMALKKMDMELRTIYNFESLMIGEGKVVPPVISMAKGLTSVNDDRREFSYVDTRYTINSQARFTNQPLTVYSYINLPEQKVKDPSTFNIPLDQIELTYWANGVYAGWVRGQRMAKNEISNNINKLNLDYLGMKRYEALEKQGIIRSPIVNKYEDTVTGESGSMDIGQTKLKLTKLPAFELNPDNWSIVPMLDKLELKLKEDND
ncbi:type IV secretory system conjugative DNA transfer family protein [Vibrio crassostreae]|uniref:type IV secretory system conjugative DNA transfer family protein n=1 Tax=Vibrio crassostreae TaxID=246167 RepID=UPI001B313E49|nr:type IV secretory system conjugative DNA transfer family protein [Vibrio crassostreae]